MNFFEHQELARRQTRRLVVLFVLAVVAIVLAVNLVGVVSWRALAQGAPLPAYFFPVNTVVVVGLIVGGTLLETWRLRSGGDEVARMIGARRLARETADLAEQRLLNIVEEMAIASGVAMPGVYVMDRETSINAFAAGYSPNEAVVAVSAGALRRLNRDELQGVVAHEFSHILNGDMRLNIRLIGVVYGLLLVALLGERLMASTRYVKDASDRGGCALAVMLMVAGLALWIIGYIGVFFGRLIKAALSRQREFLADASAVQFTRNPEGIGGALRKMAGLAGELKLGSRIDHPQAEALSHLFLGAARSAFADGLLATHPPLAERIRRIYGRAMPELEAPPAGSPEAPTAAEMPALEFESVTDFGPARATYEAGLGIAPAVMTPAAAVDAVGRPRPAEAGFARGFVADAARRALMEAVREPLGAQAVVLAVLLDRDAQVAQRQRSQVTDPVLAAALERHAPDAAALHEAMRLPVVDLAIPALKQLEAPVRMRWLALVDAFVRADGRVSLAEFVLQTLIVRRLGADAARAVGVRYHDLNRLQGDLALAASLVAHVCAAHGRGRNAQQRIDAASAELALTLPLLPAAAVRMRGIEGSLDRLNQLAPLRKPLVIKALAAAAIDAQGGLSLAGADVLRAVCAALDAPMPPVVEAVYLGAAGRT